MRILVQCAICGEIIEEYEDELICTSPGCTDYDSINSGVICEECAEEEGYEY